MWALGRPQWGGIPACAGMTVRGGGAGQASGGRRGGRAGLPDAGGEEGVAAGAWV